MSSCGTGKQKADLILINGRIYTVDQKFSVAEAMAVYEGKIVGVGAVETIQNQFNSDKIIDLNGLPVYPGFNDGHCHFYGYGENQVRYADLRGSLSFAEVVERLEKHHETFPSDWILGRGWDQNHWEIKEFPDNDMLEEVFPGKKVMLIRIDGHAILASKALITAAGIDGNTTIQGGEVLIGADGEPTGVLIDKAEDAVKKLIPPLTENEKKLAMLLAEKHCFEQGLTAVTDAGLSAGTIELIGQMHQTGALNIRINVMLNPDRESLGVFSAKGRLQTEKLTVNSVKLYADGALGSRGAKLLQPYADEPGQTGLILHTEAFYDSICQWALNHGFAVCTHAIGDSANRFVLQLYSKYLPEGNDFRWRVEHAQVVHPDDMPFFKKYAIIPSIQSTHATSDMYWAGDRLGSERLQHAYCQKDLLAQNGWLINGTDFPIEHISPVLTFYAAVSRKDLSGYPVGGFQANQALSREEALRSITSWPARGSFEEKYKGSLEVGKFADFVVLDKDIITINENEIPKVKVRQLYLSGKQMLD
jgi:hypothetical protein